MIRSLFPDKITTFSKVTSGLQLNSREVKRTTVGWRASVFWVIRPISLTAAMILIEFSMIELGTSSNLPKHKSFRKSTIHTISTNVFPVRRERKVDVEGLHDVLEGLCDVSHRLPRCDWQFNHQSKALFWITSWENDIRFASYNRCTSMLRKWYRALNRGSCLTIWNTLCTCPSSPEQRASTRGSRWRWQA